MTSLSDNADSRFVRETGPARTFADLAEPILDELGLRLVRVLVSGRDGGTVQLMVERADGQMTIEDCTRVSRRLSQLLEESDPMPGRYRLEVTSPGIDRPLVRPSDFVAFTDQEAKIELKELIDGRKRFRGILDGIENGEVRLKIELPDKPEPVVIGLPFGLISEAKLVAKTDTIRADLVSKKRGAAKTKASSAEGSADPKKRVEDE